MPRLFLFLFNRISCSQQKERQMTLEEFARKYEFPLLVECVVTKSTFRYARKIDRRSEKRWTYEICSPFIAHSLYYERKSVNRNCSTGGSVPSGHGTMRKDAREDLLKHIRRVMLYTGMERSHKVAVPEDLQ